MDFGGLAALLGQALNLLGDLGVYGGINAGAAGARRVGGHLGGVLGRGAGFLGRATGGGAEPAVGGGLQSGDFDGWVVVLILDEASGGLDDARGDGTDHGHDELPDVLHLRLHLPPLQLGRFLLDLLLGPLFGPLQELFGNGGICPFGGRNDPDRLDAAWALSHHRLVLLREWGASLLVFADPLGLLQLRAEEQIWGRLGPLVGRRPSSPADNLHPLPSQLKLPCLKLRLERRQFTCS